LGISDIKPYSLSQILESISSVITRTYSRPYWIKAEMIKLNYYTKSNHCYPDMVEKSGSKIKAQIRTTLWSSTYFRINANFLKKTGRTLGDGMNILFLAEVKFDALHGLSLNILDIDADYEIGQLAKAKNDCIAKLKNNGLFLRNKSLQFPLLPKRIAIISVNTSKGYHDFVNIIENNTRAYKFFYMLFPALLQGDAAVASIIDQLEIIERVKHHFDIVAIIRGGGGDVGLSCYDNYDLAAKVASFPLPVISGIGHSTNETVVEMVANYNPITPTDLAYFLQQRFDNNAVRIQEMESSIKDVSSAIINANKESLKGITDYIKNKSAITLQSEEHIINSISNNLKSYSKNVLIENKNLIKNSVRSVHYLSKNIINIQNQKLNGIKNRQLPLFRNRISEEFSSLNHISEKIELLKPENLLKKGYSLSYINGRIISDVNSIKEGDVLITKLFKGEIESKIIKTKK